MTALPAVATVQPPKSACEFDGFAGNLNLMQVTGKSTVGYYACSANGKCLAMPIETGNPVVVYRAEGDWICGYLSDKKGSGPGWIQAKDARPVEFDRNPPLREWLGIWTGGEDRVRIRMSKQPGKLALDGSAEWHGGGDNVHTGEFSGEVTPKGNHLNYAEGDAEACTIELTLFGKYILANDNDRCGGMNVRFWGVWTRSLK